MAEDLEGNWDGRSDPFVMLAENKRLISSEYSDDDPENNESYSTPKNLNNR